MVREKLRERMNPRLGKIDIDYAVLHDAFFKYQTKSKMTTFGDTYY
jgi:splicing factor 3B subunit 2